MKREIKFRAFDKVSKKIVFVDSIEFIDEIEGRTGFNLYIAKTKPKEKSYWREWNEVELMQYTELHDEKGKEIYEGDIVKYKDEKGYHSEFWEVIFYCGAFRIAGLPRKIRVYDIGVVFNLEVIGNIYENPELIPTE